MAEDIKQVLGFDASQALNTLKQLDGALGTLRAGLQSTSTQFTGFNKNAGRTVAALIQITSHAKAASAALGAVNISPALNANAAVQAAQSASAAFTQTGQAANAAANAVVNSTGRMARGVRANSTQAVGSINRLTISLGLLSRIVFTQAIVRALSTLRNAFRQTVGDAVEFQRKVALISTIDDSGQSLARLGDSVRSISDQFNIPLLETAEGLYQTISNQITGAAESTKFLGESAKFARSTNSSLADSVDLLSGALKAYNLDVDDTGRVSSIFFKTIDLGRITADRLSNAFGRVGPAAANLGVELEDTAAAISAISVRGSNTAESLTQFRNILTALVKPSKGMKAALRSLGFESGESAIKTDGLAGTLRKLLDSTDGSAEGLARLFPNVRGLNGVASLTADNLLTLSNNIDEMRLAGEKFTDSKFLQATQTDAEVATAQVNKLKNAFTVDLGQALLKVVADFAKLTGGVDNFISLVKEAAPAVAGLSASVIALGAAFKGAQLAGLGLSKTLAGLTLVPLAFGAGKSLGEFLDRKIFESNFGEIQELARKNVAELSKSADELRDISNKANEADKDRVKAVRQATQEIAAAYLRQKEIAISANDSLLKNTKSSITSIVSAFQKLTEAEANAAATAREIQKDSADRITGLQDKLGEIDFDAQTRGFNEARQIFALNKRSADLAAQAANSLAKANGDQDKINRGLGLFQQAQRAAEQAQSLAEKTGNRGLQQSSVNQLKNIVNQQITAERELQRAQDKRISGLNKERAIHQNLLDAVREQAKLVQDNTGVFDSAGEQFSAAEQKKRADVRIDALKSLIDLSKQIDPKKLKELGLEDFINQFQNQLTRDPIRLAFTIENEAERIKSELQGAFQDFTIEARLKTNVSVAELETALGEQAGSLNSPTKVLDALDRVTEKANQARKALDNLRISQAANSEAQREFNDLLQVANARRETPTNQDGSQIAGGKEDFNALVGLLERVSQDTEITGQEFDEAAQFVNTFTSSVRASSDVLRLKFNSSADVLDLMLEKLAKIREEQKTQAQQPAAQQLQQQLQQLDGLQQRIEKSSVGRQLLSGAQALTSGANALSATVAPATTIRLQAESASAALKSGAAAWLQASQASFQAPAAASIGKAFAKGGIASYFAGGGNAKGTDTIPAMLSKGEFVVNARSTRRFFSQLQAINAGVQPAFRSEGGVTNNISTGDIVVNGGSNPRQTGRQIAKEIRREFRRNTSSL